MEEIDRIKRLYAAVVLQAIYDYQVDAEFNSETLSSQAVEFLSGRDGGFAPIAKFLGINLSNAGYEGITRVDLVKWKQTLERITNGNGLEEGKTMEG
jgi:hypothetical protein